MAEKTRLDNVCLCSIVRDEEMNPAGGIDDFLDCTLPYVGNAVVVDTGSADKTKDLLIEAKKRYGHLNVFDCTFQGYAQARNLSLEKARLRALGNYALVLDADERLFPKDFERIGKELDQWGVCGLNLGLINIYPDEKPKSAPLHNPRCVSLKKNFWYVNCANQTYSEWLVQSVLFWTDFVENRADIVESSVNIKHFKPSLEDSNAKSSWYKKLRQPETQLQRYSPLFNVWKQLNPQRAKYG